ncbi:unnamed protein product [Symbiodinium sp. CCMP2456]|nr:unnamed protein product [Symbiodinium sp. CCMP2456]
MVLVFGFTLVWFCNPTEDSISQTGIFKFGYTNELPEDDVNSTLRDHCMSKVLKGKAPSDYDYCQNSKHYGCQEPHAEQEVAGCMRLSNAEHYVSQIRDPDGDGIFLPTVWSNTTVVMKPYGTGCENLTGCTSTREAVHKFIPGILDYGFVSFKLLSRLDHVDWKDVNAPLCRFDKTGRVFERALNLAGSMHCRAVLDNANAAVHVNHSFVHVGRWGTVHLSVPKLMELVGDRRYDNFADFSRKFWKLREDVAGFESRLPGRQRSKFRQLVRDLQDGKNDNSQQVEESLALEDSAEYERLKRNITDAHAWLSEMKGSPYSVFVSGKGFIDIPVDGPTWPSFELFDEPKQHDPNICSPRSRGGKFSIKVRTVSRYPSIQEFNGDVVDFVKTWVQCWLGLIVYDDKKREYHCFEVQITISYFRQLVYSDQERWQEEDGSLVRKEYSTSGFAFILQGERDIVKRFDPRSLIYGLASFFVIFHFPTWLCRCIAAYVGPARHIYRNAFKRKFTLNHEIVSWIVRRSSALSTFEKIAEAKDRGHQLRVDEIVRGLKKTLHEAEECEEQELADAAIQELAEFLVSKCKREADEEQADGSEGLTRPPCLGEDEQQDEEADDSASNASAEPSIPKQTFIELFEETQVLTTKQLARWHAHKGHRDQSLLSDILYQFDENVKRPIGDAIDRVSEAGRSPSKCGQHHEDSDEESQSILLSQPGPGQSSRDARALNRVGW